MNERQSLFVMEYLIDLNAEAAAIRAGYSPKYARGNAHKLVANSCISAEIDKAMAERSKRTGISQDRVLQELAKIGFANITDIVDTETAKILPNAKEEDLACIQSIKIKPNEWGTEREVKLYDKKAALVDIGKHLGMFKENVKVNVETSEKLDDILSQIGGEGLEE